MKNFFLYVDREGKMPFISAVQRAVKSHPFFVQYRDNVPVAYKGPANVLASDITGTKVWNYATNEFQPISSLQAI